MWPPSQQSCKAGQYAYPHIAGTELRDREKAACLRPPSESGRGERNLQFPGLLQRLQFTTGQVMRVVSRMEDFLWPTSLVSAFLQLHGAVPMTTSLLQSVLPEVKYFHLASRFIWLWKHFPFESILQARRVLLLAGPAQGRATKSNIPHKNPVANQMLPREAKQSNSHMHLQHLVP